MQRSFTKVQTDARKERYPLNEHHGLRNLEVQWPQRTQSLMTLLNFAACALLNKGKAQRCKECEYRTEVSAVVGIGGDSWANAAVQQQHNDTRER